jgi:ATP-binding cassette subfamily B protein
VLENLKYGNLNATMEAIEAAVDAVSARGSSKKLEKGYESDVGESGDLLSTERSSFCPSPGQSWPTRTSSCWTRRPPPSIPSPSSSSKTPSKPCFGAAPPSSSPTGFPRSVADLILVVRGGKIIEQGTHDQLLKKRGYYHALYTRQYEEEAAQHSFEAKPERIQVRA